MVPAPIPSSVDLLQLADLKQRAAREDPAALAEAAVQFEALFIGMMLKSARDAGLGQGIFDSSQTLQYLELMDQQIALDMAKSGGLGIGKMLLEQLGAAAPPPPRVPEQAPVAHFPAGLPASMRGPSTTVGVPVQAAPDVEPQAGDPAAHFVARFAADAAAAARKLGIQPKLLLAQAALETGWGESAPRHPDGSSTYNLFGIKAGGSWTGDSVAHWTLENSGGLTERKRALFRAYPSSTASFTDYVDLIAGSPRYAAAVQNAGDPAAYVRAVTAAGYATDPGYADKWLSIYHGDRLQNAITGLKQGVLESTQ